MKCNEPLLLRTLINKDNLITESSSDFDFYLCCVLQTLEASLGALLQLLSLSAEVFHLLAPPPQLQHLPQLPLPLSHGLQITMETAALPQQRLSPWEHKLQVKERGNYTN